MKIQIIEGFERADRCRGLTVAIDVLRAFSTVCYLFAAGVEQVLAVSSIEKARAAKKARPEALLLGEKEGRPLPDFDLGNSPTEIVDRRPESRLAILRTTAGTTGMLAARGAGELLAGSFLNVAANLSYIQRKKPRNLSLLATRSAFAYPFPDERNEDLACACFMKDILEGKSPDFQAVEKKIRKTTLPRFSVPANQAWNPRSDYFLCLQLNKFDFVVKGRRTEENGITLKILKAGQ